MSEPDPDKQVKYYNAGLIVVKTGSVWWWMLNPGHFSVYTDNCLDSGYQAWNSDVWST